MFKKALQVATTFVLLVAGYTAYVQVFALLARGLTPTKGLVWIPPLEESKTSREATALAVLKFGKESWQAQKKLPIRIYNPERGFWMYAENYQRLDEGKTIELSRFAVICQSRDGVSYKTATSDMARLDFDRAVGAVGGSDESTSQKIIRARFEGNVEILDDKGTPDRGDDLKITRLKHLVYDEKALQISSTSDLMIVDGDTTITGTELLIKLRPKEDGPPGASSGFNGAQTAIIYKNVHILMRDVGANGILPGTPVTAGANAPTSSAVKREPTPLDLRCDRRMQVDLPKPHPFAAVGPPAPVEPTFAEFFLNVEVLRGAPNRPRDSLTCDQLKLTLIPGEKPPGVETGGAAGDTASNLTLRRADATGQNVWLVSAAQGVKARCNQLIHKKRMPEAPDETYFRGDTASKLVIEKTDVVAAGPDQGKVTAYTLIRTVDATIFDDGTGNDNATIVARGPGDMEARPAADKPVERTAHWLDQLTMQPDEPGAKSPAVKRLTLTGKPGFTDVVSQSSLDARRTLIVWLVPKPVAPTIAGANAVKTDPGVSKTGGAFDIQKLLAVGDVLLKAPGKTLTARDRLDAVFEAAIPTIVVDARDRPAPPTPAGAAVTATSPATTPAKPGAPAATPAPARPVEPEARATADRVWAKIILLPTPAVATVTPAPAPTSGGGGLLSGGGSGGKQAEIDTVMLRGNVTFHQDPGAGKVKGTDVSGQAVDVFKTGAETSKFIVFDEVPPEPGKAVVKAPEPADVGDAFEQVIAKATRRDDPFAALAKVDTDELSIRGKVIGLDQSSDDAWVDRLGSLTRMTAPGLLSDKRPEPAKAKADASKPVAAAVVAEPPKGPMTITFTDGMKFLGRSTDPLNRAVARAEFFGEVHAWTDDSSLDCGERLRPGQSRANALPSMRLYLDRVVTLSRPKTDPKAPAQAQADDKTKADVASVECVQNVIAVNLKRDPDSGELLEAQRIVGEVLTYEKATGKFVVPTEGEVFLYQRDGQGGPSVSVPKLGDAKGNTDHRVVLTSGPGRAANTNASTNTDAPAAVIGRNANTVRNPAAPVRPPARTRALPPLVLTQIHFTREMHGRFGSGTATDATEVRWADFFGDVEVLRAKVPGLNTVIDPDERPPGTQSITSQILRVISEPSRDPKNPKAPPRNLLRAWEDSYATIEDKIIQADTITYDSLFNVFYAYGEDGKDVLIAQSQKFGQPASLTEGRAAMYNVATGESKLIEPTSIALVDQSTGARPLLVKEKKDETKIKKPPRTKFRNLRGNVERKDFTGR